MDNKEKKVKNETEIKTETTTKKETKKKTNREVEELHSKLAESEDNLLRVMAEYDNFRKRTVKEKADIYLNSKSDVVNEFLPIIDNFERAASNAEADFEGYKKGIEIIFSQFIDVMSKFGVESFGTVGEEFNPEIHSAVSVIQDENLGENVISQVFSKGYKLGDKIIREAVVQVANS